MKVNILYDEYSTKIKKATLLFGDTPETEQAINLEVIQENIGESENELLVNKVKITSIDSNSIEIQNQMNKEELRTFLTLIRNLLTQM